MIGKLLDNIADLICKWLDKRRYYFFKTNNNPVKLICLLRVRNEELIIGDTLSHLQQICDGVLCYDDASNDKTFSIIRNHPAVWAAIRNYRWKNSIEERLECETRDRALLLALASKYNPEWIMCVDADERFLGDIRGFLLSKEEKDVDAVRIQLFDAYMTKDDNRPFQKGDKLLNFRKYFGIERRDILMLWKHNKNIQFVGKDSREPTFLGNNRFNVITRFYCQHYGKSLSVEHWEETCNYYINYFPPIYSEKWKERRGKAIHEKSDFGTKLYTWEEAIKNSVKIYP